MGTQSENGPVVKHLEVRHFLYKKHALQLLVLVLVFGFDKKPMRLFSTPFGLVKEKYSFCFYATGLTKETKYGNEECPEFFG